MLIPPYTELPFKTEDYLLAFESYLYQGHCLARSLSKVNYVDDSVSTSMRVIANFSNEALEALSLYRSNLIKGNEALTFEKYQQELERPLCHCQATAAALSTVEHLENEDIRFCFSAVNALLSKALDEYVAFQISLQDIDYSHAKEEV